MKLSQINEALDHKITSGSEYQWNCYPDSRYLDYESDFAYVSVIYSTIDQTIYQAEVSVKREAWDEDKKPYRWLNPDYKDAFITESNNRNIDTDIAWDDIKWIELETDEDFLEKSKAMFNGNYWDTRIQLPINLDDDVIMHLAMDAHKRDITLNKMIEIVLQEMIDRHRVNNMLDQHVI